MTAPAPVSAGVRVASPVIYTTTCTYNVGPDGCGTDDDYPNDPSRPHAREAQYYALKDKLNSRLKNQDILGTYPGRNFHGELNNGFGVSEINGSLNSPREMHANRSAKRHSTSSIPSQEKLRIRLSGSLTPTLNGRRSPYAHPQRPSSTTGEPLTPRSLMRSHRNSDSYGSNPILVSPRANGSEHSDLKRSSSSSLCLLHEQIARNYMELESRTRNSSPKASRVTFGDHKAQTGQMPKNGMTHHYSYDSLASVRSPRCSNAEISSPRELRKEKKFVHSSTIELSANADQWGTESPINSPRGFHQSPQWCPPSPRTSQDNASSKLRTRNKVGALPGVVIVGDVGEKGRLLAKYFLKKDFNVGLLDGNLDGGLDLEMTLQSSSNLGRVLFKHCVPHDLSRINDGLEEMEKRFGHIGFMINLADSSESSVLHSKAVGEQIQVGLMSKIGCVMGFLEARTNRAAVLTTTIHGVSPGRSIAENTVSAGVIGFTRSFTPEAGGNSSGGRVNTLCVEQGAPVKTCVAAVVKLAEDETKTGLVLLATRSNALKYIEAVKY